MVLCARVTNHPGLLGTAEVSVPKVLLLSKHFTAVGHPNPLVFVSLVALLIKKVHLLSSQLFIVGGNLQMSVYRQYFKPQKHKLHTINIVNWLCCLFHTYFPCHTALD